MGFKVFEMDTDVCCSQTEVINFTFKSFKILMPKRLIDRFNL